MRALVFSLEGHHQPHHPVTPSPSPGRLPSSTSFVLWAKTAGTVLCQSGGFGHLLCKVRGTGLRDPTPGTTGKEETAGCSHGETTAGKPEPQSTFSPGSHSTSSLAALGELAAVEKNGGTGNTSRRSTAMAAWPAGMKEGVSELNPARALLQGHKEIG